LYIPVQYIVSRTFTIFIEQDRIYVAKVPEIPRCYTQGKTVEQAMERVEEVIQVCIEAEKEEIAQFKFVGVQQVEVSTNT
jgi:predicted RNase H-like HicB family nuclease